MTPAAEGITTVSLLFGIVMILSLALLGRIGARKLGLPTVFGELLTGILIRKSMTSSEQCCLKHSSSSVPVSIRTGRPMKAMASLKLQKNRVARMMIRKTVTDMVCAPLRPQA
jgi:Kef-type K+ transport system membrane component KefB